ncbi:MAG: hypothetical protein ACTSSP_09185 [Candidatus Asgardarchaeia archaeon]
MNSKENSKTDILRRIAKKLYMHSKLLQENYETMLKNFKARRSYYDSGNRCYKGQASDYIKACNNTRENAERIVGITDGVISSNLLQGNHFESLAPLFESIKSIAGSLAEDLRPVYDHPTDCYRKPEEYSWRIHTLQGNIDTLVSIAGLDLSESSLDLNLENINSLLERVNLLEKRLESIEKELMPLIKEVRLLLQQYQKSLRRK